MRWSSGLAFLASLAAIVSPAMGEQLLETNSLNECQANSKFTASLFTVIFTPNNRTASVNMVATSSIQGYVTFDIQGFAYGYPFLRQTVNPCDLAKNGLCPMVAGKIPFGFDITLSESAVGNIPSIAYSIPDLDAKVRVTVNLTSTGESVACLEANISNGQTVDLLGVKWALAIVAGLALVSSAIISGLGHTNAAAHVAANSLSLFGYFQSLAILGLTGVTLPPIVQSWTQDFQWSLGIIEVPFMQSIFTWYQRSTGGTPSTIFNTLTTVSVQVQKRAIDLISEQGGNLLKRGAEMMPNALNRLMKRGNITTGNGSFIVYGIQRVAFRGEIESTNMFMTVLVFFCLAVIFTVLAVAICKGIVELCVKQGWMSHEKFQEFRNGWITIMKGILFRVSLIGFPQLCIFCLWEFTQDDSPAEMVLAVFFLLGIIITLAWGASKVIIIARRSVAMHRNPAYILYSDPTALNKWGFLYVQFRASAYYFIAPVLGYTLIKAMFVAFAQANGVVQAIAFVVLEAAALIAASVLRPWMDKSTNSLNITICVINFLNAVFLLIFSNVWDAPGLVVGVVGVVLFVLNAVCALVLLIMIIVTTCITLFRKNPDARYQFMGDDRSSFMKSQTQVNTTTELDALAATARGDKSGYKAAIDLDDDESIVYDEPNKPGAYLSANQSQVSFHNGPRSPVNPSMPLFPAGHRPESPFRSNSPSPYNRSGSAMSNNRPAATSSPWQRGAGYEH